MAPSASLPARTWGRQRTTTSGKGGGAPSVGGSGRQPSEGSMDVRPARTRAGRVRPGSPVRQGHPMYSICSKSRAAR
eukprot:3162804-Alexandrium_andersonii.AAC.1